MWRWLTTPAEPRGRYGVYVSVVTFALLLMSQPLWFDRGVLAIVPAACIAALLAVVTVKLAMERLG